MLCQSRAARGLGIELLEAVDRKYGGQTVLLPKIRTLGDLDEDEIRTGFDNDTLNFMSQLPAALRVIPPAKRHISLARFVQTWIKAMSPQTLALFEEEKIVLPSSSGDALRLAKDLSHFMDQIEAEEADWDLIKNVAADEFNEWWQLTLSFLSIIMDAWPRSLAQDGFINPSEFRNQVIDFRIRQLTENPPAGPVIAAGTTGSVAATTRLLTKINEMENGAIVLPGFDTNLPQIVLKRFREIDTDSFDNASSSHPQYGMVRLLDRLHTQPSDVVEIGQTDPSSSHRCKVTNTIMLPAEDTAHWIDDHHDARSPDLAKAFETVSIIEAKGQQQEGLSIAIALRKVLETQGKTAALITPDRKLARRVSTELERFGIQIDDSAGSALSLSQPAMFVRQILRCVFSGNDPASLSAVIKSKYLHTLKPNESPNNLVDLLELLLVRSAIVMPDLGALGEAVARQKIVLDQDKHVPKPLRKLSEETWQSLGQFAESLSEIFAPLVALSKSHSAIAINDLMQVRLGLECDRDGKVARGGEVVEGALELFLDDPYFARMPPKSLDRDRFAVMIDLVRELSDKDAAATLTAMCAASVSRGMEHCPEPPERVLVTGGGRHNPVLMEMLRVSLDCPVEPVEAVGLDGDMLEAQAFASLAVRVARGLPTSGPSTTGVRAAVGGGEISYPSKG